MKIFESRTVFCGATILFLLSQPITVFAEGAVAPNTAGFGANRRIKTNANYQGVRGYFTVPTFSIPVEYSLNGTLPDPNRPRYNPILTNYLTPDLSTTNPDGTITQTPDGRPDELEGYMNKATTEGWAVENSVNSNPNDSKPTFYLGSGSGGLEVDAGLQWEWVPLYGFVPGWSIFISRNGAFDNPRVPLPNGSIGAYRAGPGTPNPTVSQFQLQYSVEEDGRARLITTSTVYTGTADFNPNGVDFTWRNTPVYYQPTPTNLTITALEKATIKAAMRVKRIVGITQIGGEGNPASIRAGDARQLDGSWMRGCTFSGGEIQQGGVWQTWTAAQTDNTTADATGYAPGRFNAAGAVVNNNEGQSINDKDNGNPRLYKVDFPGITVQASSTTPAPTEEQIRRNAHNQPGDGSRYATEQVDINLQKGGTVTGISIRPARYQYNTPPEMW